MPLTLGHGGLVEAFPLELLGQRSQLEPGLLEAKILPMSSYLLTGSPSSRVCIEGPATSGSVSSSESSGWDHSHQAFGGMDGQCSVIFIGLKRDVSGRQVRVSKCQVPGHAVHMQHFTGIREQS